jgi:hypothetical protein
VVLVAAVIGCSEPSETPAASSTTTPTTPVTEPAPASTTTVTEVAPFALPTGVAWARDFPDPFVTVIGDRHLAVATTSGWIQLQGLTSPELTDWSGPLEMLAELPGWATPWSAWAPALLPVGGDVLLYYTAQVAGTEQHCISVARQRSPGGPFVDDSTEPFLCPSDQGGAIDPSPFRDVDGQLYLLWKNDGVTLRQESAIWSQRLSDDGLALTSSAVRLISTDQAWEYPHVEAPSMVRRGDDYWLAYSGSWWNAATYGVGLARCASPSGPCVKPFDRPVLQSSAGMEGPGGGEFFVDRSGRLLLAFHAWLDEPGYPGHRALRVATVSFDSGVLTVTPS